MAPRLHLGAVPPDAVVVLFEQRFWEPVARGEVTVTFRRWKRRQAITGNRYRTPMAIIEADAVDVITVDDITDADARAGGYRSSSALIADLRGSADLDLYRIRFHVVDEPDPRATLAGDAALSTDDREDIDRRLDRLDRASSHGAWTRETLRLIERMPATRACRPGRRGRSGAACRSRPMCGSSRPRAHDQPWRRLRAQPAWAGLPRPQR